MNIISSIQDGALYMCQTSEVFLHLKWNKKVLMTPSLKNNCCQIELKFF